MNSILLFGLLVLSIATSINALKVEGFTIDTDLKKGLATNLYDLPGNVMINLSDNEELCPSNQCEVKLEGDAYFAFLSLNEAAGYMSLSGDVRLQDDLTNGHLTPKKQNLVEKISLSFQCSFNDIIEEKGSTRYVCNDAFGTIMRVHNMTMYSYDFSASFELPSRHYSLNATG